MDSQRIKQMLSDRDVWQLLVDLGAEPIAGGNIYTCKTVCHHGDKMKLYYHRDTKSFRCYTGACGSMDIFSLVQNHFDIEFYAALIYVANKFGIVDDGESFVDKSNKIENPGAIFEKKLKRAVFPEIEILDDKILNDFYFEYFHKSWIDEGISISAMNKFGISYSIEDNQIIIPHRDKDGNLIGVRARNLNQSLVDQGKKYMPIYNSGKVLKHPTGANLYGMDLNKHKIDELRCAILFESEKSVLQLESFYPELSIGLCVSGSNLTEYQLELLKERNIEEVIVALDKEFSEIGDEDEKFYAQKIEKVFQNRLSPFFRVSVLWDQQNLLKLKDSPTDEGLEVFNKLLETRIYLN